MPDRTIRRGEFVARHAERPVRAALADTRIVAIVGPRQSGKTTLACGIILHDGERVQQAGSKLFAMPVKMLWTN